MFKVGTKNRYVDNVRKQKVPQSYSPSLSNYSTAHMDYCVAVWRYATDNISNISKSRFPRIGQQE